MVDWLLKWYARLKTLSGLVPSPYREIWIAAALGIMYGVVAWLLAFLDSQPPHVVFLAAVWSFAAVAFFAWVTLSLYWRLTLVRLIRDGEAFIETGVAVRAAMKNETDMRVFPGRLRAVEDWRTAMHRRMLPEPRIAQFREALREKDPTHDRITYPLAALDQALNHLRTYL